MMTSTTHGATRTTGARIHNVRHWLLHAVYKRAEVW